VGLVDSEGVRRPEAELVTLTVDVLDAEAEPVAVREAAGERELCGEAVVTAEMVPTPPPEDEGEPEGDIVGRGGPDRVPVTLTLRLNAPETLAETHAVGVLELATDLDGDEETLGQRDAATVRDTVEEIRAEPERRTETVALGEADGVLD
jgi:hypothetical protein